MITRDWNNIHVNQILLNITDAVLLQMMQNFPAKFCTLHIGGPEYFAPRTRGTEKIYMCPLFLIPSDPL